MDLGAWKQVDLAHAQALEAGSVKLGRLNDYSNLENGRADPMEARVQFHSGTLSQDVPEHRAAMERFGIIGGSGGRITGSVHEVGFPPLYAFCMSEIGCEYDPSPDVPKATFEVSNVKRLALLLLHKQRARVHRYKCGPVSYERRVFDALEPPVLPDPFVKSPQFAVEREIRIALVALPGAPFETIISDPDPDIAALLTRIA